jgi:hypothetical protein
VFNFIIHKGDEKDPGPDQSFIPQDQPSVWILSGDETIYNQRGAAEKFVTFITTARQATTAITPA